LLARTPEAIQERDAEGSMKIGAVFPQFEGAVDVGAVGTFARAIETMGYDYIVVSDHVIGVTLSEDNDWDGGAAIPLFRDPFVFCSFMAAVTTKIEFLTAVTVIPQRQTLLMAKQIADLDELSGGRFRFGVGTGWCQAEYEALGADFSTRGKIFEEQIELLRELWTKPKVTMKTPYHSLSGVGLRPLPVQRPVPIWIGGADAHLPNVERLLRRVARMADGWIPHLQPTDEGRAHIARFQNYCREYGRDPGNIGLQAFIALSRGNQDTWVDQLKMWNSFDGVNHIAISTATDNIKGLDGNLRMFQDFLHAIA
jgi:probable F420-dependent oxidoreductase